MPMAVEIVWQLVDEIELTVWQWTTTAGAEETGRVPMAIEGQETGLAQSLATASKLPLTLWVTYRHSAD